MTNSHEPSYYEIALTNRQVVVAFVILLVCLVSAFFSGLYIGRESAVRAQDQMVRNTPPTPAVPQEGQALEELHFFEDDQHAQRAGTTGSAPGQTPPTETPGPAQATPTPEETTLVEDLGGAPEEPAADPDLPEGRRHRGKGGRGGRGAAEAEGEESATVTPVPSPTPARQSTPAKTPASSEPGSEPRSEPRSEPKIAKGQLVIQVFSTADADQAEGVRARLVKGGQKAFLSPVKVGGRTMYRVRIGPFDSRDQAQKVAEQVRKGYKLDTWVTE